ncbi:MAG: baseplate J/gp47 family protein [Reinekea sp.]
MTQTFPEYTDLRETFESNFESKIGQNIPATDKAFLKILAENQAITAVLLRVENINAIKENLILTASLTRLKEYGVEYDVPYNDETSTVLTATLPATTGTTIPANINFVGDDNSLLYYTNTSVIAAAGVATLTLTCRTPGAVGNLSPAQTLTISSQISGAEQIATITAVSTTGADAEAKETYRQRLLDVVRAPGGGANSADYRNWAQEEEGIVRAYPYSGNPTYLGGGGGSINPPDRTVYCECDTSIESDGITPAGLLTTTKATIIADPDTGLHREPLGLTSDTLYVVAISRTTFYVQIISATFISGTTAQVKSDINDALTAYFLSLEPFISGLDVDEERNDLITIPSVTKIIQQILAANSASAEGVGFGTLPGSFVPSYQLGAGEKAKFFGTASYI